MKLRGYLTIAVCGAGLIALDPVQRSVVAGLARALPGRRIAILGWWGRMLAYFVINTARRIGGARIPPPPTVPGHGGVMVLMNHQSVLDTPLVVASLRPHHPLIVTRARYARGKRLISHMVRLYQYPVVEPRATSRRSLERLAAAAGAAPVPIVVFPEGHRTRDGRIGPWQEGGLRAILGARRWTIHLLVADGYWRSARLTDFIESVSKIDGRAVTLGPFESPEPGADPEPFIAEMRVRMQAALNELRARVPAA